MANLEFCDTHNMVAYLNKIEESKGFHQILDFLNSSHIKYALTENLTIYVSLIQQFWQTAATHTLDIGEMEITTTIDGKVKIVTEASIRRHLKLEDSVGINTFPNTEIFKQLALMGYMSNSDKLTFQKGHFSPQWRFLIHTILHCLSTKKTAWEQFSSNIATAIICLATNRTFNFSKMIFDGMVKNLDSKSKFLMYPRFIQIFLNKHKRLLLPHNRTYIAPTLTQKLFSNMRRASKGYTGVDIPMFPTMIFQGPVILGEGSIVPIESHHTPTGAPSTSQPPISSPSKIPTREESKVPQPRSPTHTPAVDEAASTGSGNIDKTPSIPYDSPLPRVHTLGSDEGRMQHNELMDLVIKLSDRVLALETNLQKTKKVYSTAFTKLIMKVKKLEKIVKSSKARRRAKIVVSDDEDDAEDSSKQGRKIDEINQDPDIYLVQHDAEVQGRHEQEIKFETKVYTAEDVSTAEPVSTAGAAVTTVSASISTASPPRVSTAEDISTAKTLVYIRRSASKDKGKGIMTESEPEQTKTKLQQRQERAGYEAAIRLQEQLDKEERRRITRVQEETSSFNIEEWEDIQATIEVDEELAQRIQAEEREKYSEAKKARLLIELINQGKRNFAQQRAKEGGTSHSDRLNRGLTCPIISNTWEVIHCGKSKGDKIIPKLPTRSSKRDAEEELDQGSSKRQKTGESSRPAEESKDKYVDDMLQEELQQMMIMVLEEGMNVKALDNLVNLWSLVQESFNSTRPTEDKEIELWVELKRLFESDANDKLWKSQKHVHDITWKLYDTCGVHHVSTKDGIDIYMLVEKEYPLSRGVLTQMLAAKLLVEQNNEISRELLRKIFMQVERPRR
ncbi:hypothetical protein Tco_1097653 [Tanacetum coccineum]